MEPDVSHKKVKKNGARLNLGLYFVSACNGGDLLLPHQQTHVRERIQGPNPQYRVPLMREEGRLIPRQGRSVWKQEDVQRVPHTVQFFGLKGESHHHDHDGVGYMLGAELQAIGGAPAGRLQRGSCPVLIKGDHRPPDVQDLRHRAGIAF